MKPIDEILSDFNIEPEYIQDCKDYALSILSDIMNDKYYTIVIKNSRLKNEYNLCYFMYFTQSTISIGF